jgi:hypothetical protein
VSVGGAALLVLPNELTGFFDSSVPDFLKDDFGISGSDGLKVSTDYLAVRLKVPLVDASLVRVTMTGEVSFVVITPRRIAFGEIKAAVGFALSH